MERTVPWWRRALSFALGGIVGLFRRNGNREADEVASATNFIAARPPEEQDQKFAEPETEPLVDPFTSPPESVWPEEPIAPEFQPAAVAKPAPEAAEAEISTNHTESAIEDAAPKVNLVEATFAQLIEAPAAEMSADPLEITVTEEPIEAKGATEPPETAVEAAPDDESRAAIAEEPSIMAIASNVEDEFSFESELAERFVPPVPAHAPKTTEPAEAASAGDMYEPAETTAKAASEITDEFERQPPRKEESTGEGVETPSFQPGPAPIVGARDSHQQIAKPAPEEERNPQPASALESASAQAEEPVTSEEVTEPIQPHAEPSPEGTAKRATEEAAEAQPAKVSTEAPAAEHVTVPPAGMSEPPTTPQPPIPEPPPVSALAEADAAPTLPFAEKAAERTTAEKVAAALKAREARGEDADQSPFSVLVNQVYDGPLDLLLDLIRKQDIDIYDIPIAKITAQFLAYVDRLRATDMDVAGEFIYTAALLIHIKSKMLLPRAPAGPDDAAEDPRRELVERLLEHERFKNAAQMLHEKQMLEAATWTNPGVREFKEDSEAEPEIAADTTDLVRVFSSILERARNRPIINVEEDSVTVGQMIQFLARRLTMEDRPVALRRMLSHTNSERALIAMFLALLELVRLQAILLRQDRHFSEIFIKKHTGFDALMNQGLAEARDDWR